MVQMKVKKSLFIFSLFYSFISHMVQMKAGGNFLDNSSCSLYIPHGSDESGVGVTRGDIYIYFISHMVQMKGCGRRIFASGSKLYIPHGSDERSRVPSKRFFLKCFISHMVQMKGLVSLPSSF